MFSGNGLRLEREGSAFKPLQMLPIRVRLTSLLDERAVVGYTAAEVEGLGSLVVDSGADQHARGLAATQSRLLWRC